MPMSNALLTKRTLYCCSVELCMILEFLVILLVVIDFEQLGIFVNVNRETIEYKKLPFSLSSKLEGIGPDDNRPSND